MKLKTSAILSFLYWTGAINAQFISKRTNSPSVCSDIEYFDSAMLRCEVCPVNTVSSADSK